MSENIIWLERNDLDREAIKRILPCYISIDIGAGINLHPFISGAICICFEPYAEYVDLLKQEIQHRFDKIYVVKKKTWAEALDCLKGIKIDTVFLIDVIEHLPKDEGKELLRRTESITRQQIVIFTPLGFIAQHTLEGGKDAWGLNGAEWQEHKSGWMPEDFDNSWDILACRDYHIYSNTGKKLDEAFGAFWAMKTFKNDEESQAQQLHRDITEAIQNRVKKDESIIEILKNKLEISRQELGRTQKELGRTQQELGNAQRTIDNAMKIINHPLVKIQISFYRFITKIRKL